MSDPTEATILLAEEHDATRAFLQDNLSADGYRVLVAPDRAKALALLSTAHPDLIVVDVNGQTLELIDAVRSGEGIAGYADPETPMIVLSRDADRLQRIRLLERGGDDVVKKPFAYPELRARIGAVLRRSQATRRGRRMLRAGPVVIDVRSRDVQVRRAAGRAVGDRVPTAPGTRRRSISRLHPRRAPAIGLGPRHIRAHSDPRHARVPASPQAVRGLRRQAGGQCVGRRLPADGRGEHVMSAGGTPGSVEGLYEQLACQRAGQARALLARQVSVERLFAESAAALEDAAGVLLHAATAFISIEGPLPGLFAEQAGALLAVAARFEEAADLSRSGDHGEGEAPR